MAAPRFKLTVTASDGTTTVFSDTSDTDRTDDSGLVLSFEGDDYISRPFEFRLKLEYHIATSGSAFDFSKLVNQEAALTMIQDALDQKGDPGKAAVYINDTTLHIKGILSSFRVTKKIRDGVLQCEAVLVPELWRLSLSNGSRVFQNQTTQQIVTSVLAEAGLQDTVDFEFKLSGTAYPVREFCMQYQESNLSFVQRLLEDEGIFYYFDDQKLIFSDDQRLPSLEGRRAVWFYEPTGAMTPTDDQVYSFIYSEHVVPQKVRVEDYDFEAFQDEDKADVETDVHNTSEDYARVGIQREHGRFVEKKKEWVSSKGADPDGDLAAKTTTAITERDGELTRIATIRAQELEAQRKTATALSTVARIQPGHVFDLTDHFLFDDAYLVKTVRHEYVSGAYRNEFQCVAAAVQYRPPRSTSIPRVPGVLTAKVKGSDPTDDDAEPHIDNEGRYRVQFPFDPNAASAAEPSRPVRLAQPYAGKDYGMHFPARGEVEMVLACLDGDPDRPLGLSVVPTPWKHSPVPDAKLTLGSQNPTTGSSTGAETTFMNHKNVLRTQRGHQLVMDDDEGGANVGITLQAGKAKNSAGKDIYWGSKIELGGYRHLSVLERILGIASTAVGYFRSVFTRDFPGMASEALGIVASQVMTDDYVDDTFGTTTPVGVNIYTNKNVNVTGKDGINITSPNLFGMFSTDLMPNPDGDTSKRQYQAEAISKFLINTVWQEVMNGTADELMDLKETAKKYKTKKVKNPKTQAALKWKENVKDQRVSSLIFTLLQRTGVNVSSMGELKLSSLQSTSVAAGQGGLALKSFGGIEQKADLDVEIAAHQGITISSKGVPYKGKGILKAVSKLSDKVLPLKGLVAMIQTKFSNAMLDPTERFKIELENEEGDIFLHTGTGDKKGGDIMAHVEGDGDMKSFVNEGQIHAWSGGYGGIYLEVGDRKGDDNETLPKEDAKGVMWIKEDEVQGFSARKVQLYVGADYTKKTDSAITIEDGQIELKCGQASIVMKKNGDITIKGNAITIDGTSDVDVKAQNITSAAKANHKSTGLNVAAEARAKASIKGSVAMVEGQLTTVKGSLVKVGS